MALQFIEISGTARERGSQYGTKAGDKITGILGYYREWFEEYCNVKWEEAKKEAAVFGKQIEKYDSSLAEEIEGIAGGAQVPIEEIMLLNARTEVAFRFLPECTSIGKPGKGGTPEGAFIAQNWDWLARNGESTIGLTIRQNNKPDIFTFTEAGMVGKFGINSDGLALCVNLLGGSKSQDGIPFHILARSVLNSSSMGGALQAVTKPSRAFSGYFMIGHAAGEVLGIEFAPGNYEVFGPHKGYLAHTNHFLAGHLTECDREKRDYPDTIVRYFRAHNLAGGQMDTENVRLLLADHFNWPDSICRHPNPEEPESWRTKTLISAIFLLDQKVILYTEGNPCENEYRALSFDDVL